MLDHISLRVGDMVRATEFYRAALAPVGYKVAMEYPNFVGMGDEGMPDFWITPTDKASSGTHIAFRTDRARVDAFYAAALAAGGIDNGAPGLRADYHPHYYAAYVIDPEGNNVEVVCHDPPGMPKVPPARTAAARRPAKRALAKRPARKAKPSKPSKPSKPTKSSRPKKPTKPKKRR
jgi:catechol 2,3-dioxygenase-like lactoylglutathione lyase family enzyme